MLIVVLRLFCFPCKTLPWLMSGDRRDISFWNFLFPKVSMVPISFQYNLVCFTSNFWRCVKWNFCAKDAKNTFLCGLGGIADSIYTVAFLVFLIEIALKRGQNKMVHFVQSITWGLLQFSLSIKLKRAPLKRRKQWMELCHFPQVVIFCLKRNPLSLINHRESANHFFSKFPPKVPFDVIGTPDKYLS